MEINTKDLADMLNVEELELCEELLKALQLGVSDAKDYCMQLAADAAMFENEKLANVQFAYSAMTAVELYTAISLLYEVITSPTHSDTVDAEELQLPTALGRMIIRIVQCEKVLEMDVMKERAFDICERIWAAGIKLPELLTKKGILRDLVISL